MRRWMFFLLLGTAIFTLGGCEEASQVYSVTLVGSDETVTEEATGDEAYVPKWQSEEEGFIGWYLDEAKTLPAAFAMPVQEDLTLYAKYEKDPGHSDEAMVEALVAEMLEDLPLYDYDTSDIDSMVETHLNDAVENEDALLENLQDAFNVIAVLNEERTAMIDEVSRSVVMIDTYHGNNPESGGSGVLYKQSGDRYYVLTNEHVVTDYETGDFGITLFLDETHTIPRQDVTLHGSSVAHDLAVLSFESPEQLPLIEFGSADFKQGEEVYAVGSPLDLPNTVTKGIISAFDRPMEDEYGMDTTMIQHTASINAGNSGGALINWKGELVGINAMSYVDEYVGEGIEGLHFAVQIDTIEALVDSLEE